MVKEHTLATRYRAVGMIKSAMTQAQGGGDLDVGVATIRRWQTRDSKGETWENRTSRGRKSAMSRLARIIVAKSAFERHHSTRTLAEKLTAKNTRSQSQLSTAI